jgi:hypothetical protein
MTGSTGTVSETENLEQSVNPVLRVAPPRLKAAAPLMANEPNVQESMPAKLIVPPTVGRTPSGMT